MCVSNIIFVKTLWEAFTVNNQTCQTSFTHPPHAFVSHVSTFSSARYVSMCILRNITRNHMYFWNTEVVSGSKCPLCVDCLYECRSYQAPPFWSLYRILCIRSCGSRSAVCETKLSVSLTECRLYFLYVLIIVV